MVTKYGMAESIGPVALEGRGEVSGGGKKPWKQKGTGRARVGSVRSPIWKGGGVTFGPTNDRNFSKKLNDKMRKKALCIVLSDKIADKRLAIVDDLSMTEFKTKTLKKAVQSVSDKAFEIKGRATILIIDKAPQAATKASARNLPELKMLNVENLNIVDLLKYKAIIATSEAVKVIEERYK
jgi:large subunit ribosomal protein L4